MPVYELGYHKKVAVATASAVMSAALTPGYYTLIAQGCNMYVNAGSASAVTVSAAEGTFIPSGWGLTFRVRQDSANAWVAGVNDDATSTGTLHANKHSDIV